MEWFWVKGHAGHPENERADELACRGSAEAAAQGASAPGAAAPDPAILEPAVQEPVV